MKNILIAEDTYSNYLLLSVILNKHYNVAPAVNGQEAVEMFKAQAYDVVLMDTKMPIMDGLQATREIRKMNANVPIIALTANAFDSDHQKATEAGCTEYMTKPIVAKELIDLLKRILGE